MIDAKSFVKFIEDVYLKQEEAVKAKYILDHCVPWNLSYDPEIEKLKIKVDNLMHFDYESNPQIRIPEENFRRIARAQWAIKKIMPKRNVFSFGVGGGEFENILAKDKDCTVVGYHPNPEWCDELHFKTHKKVFIQPEIPFEEKFDYFVMMEVIEHLNHEEIDILEKIKPMAETFIFTVPYGPLQHGTRKPYDFKAYEHIRVFNEASFFALLEEYGYQPIETEIFFHELQICAMCVKKEK